MKDATLLVWLTQLGLSVAIPLIGFPLVGLWLVNKFGWGQWVFWVALVLGICTAADGFRTSLKTLNRLAAGKKESKKDEPPSFSQHD